MRLTLGFVCLLLAAGYVLAGGLYPGVDWIQTPAMRLLYPVLVVVLSTLGLVAAASAKRQDPLLVAWGMLGLAGCLLVIPLALARDQQDSQDLLSRSLVLEQRKQLKLQQQQREQIRRAEEADRRRRAKSDRFVQYEGRIPADTLDTLRRLDSRMSAQVEEAANAYASALKLNPTKGPDAWIRFRTLAQVEQEWSAHKVLYEQTRAFTQFIEGFEQRYSLEIEQLRLKPPADRIAIAELERILQLWEQSRIYQLRQLDVQALAAALNALGILRDQWGNWSFSPRDDQLLFDDPAREAAFYQALQSLQQIAKEVEQLTADSPGNF